MNRINLIDRHDSQGESRELLDSIHAAFGTTPNMFRAVAHSPAALRSMWGSFAALSKGTIPALLGEQIAVAVADFNRCEYCLAAHTLLGRKAGGSAEDMAAAREGKAADARNAAALAFALKVVERRGQVDEEEVRALRAAGFDDAHIVEILAHVALNLFTNYVNVALAVPVDFPRVELSRAAVAA